MIFDILPYVATACFFLYLGIIWGGIARNNQHDYELRQAIDRAYGDGYEQRREDELHGIHRLPTHRP